MTTFDHENGRMSILYEASFNGSVSVLNSLIQQDPLILSRVSQTAFTETPLHICVLLGHFEFIKLLLTHKSQLALELDSSRRTALHLASAEGHIDIVKELLRAHDQACLVQDEEEMIPLHYAAMRGRTEVAKELIMAKPESLGVLSCGKSIFHLCVTYNRLETLKALVEMEIDGARELLKLRDSNGNNTILHLAVMLKQVETIKYLLSIPTIREAASLTNDLGITAQDIMERFPKDFKSLQMQLILRNAGINAGNIRMDAHPQLPPSTTTTNDVVNESAVRTPNENCWKKTLNRIIRWFEYKAHNWLDEMRGIMSVVATVISTITFQAGISPPGGVAQQGLSKLSSLDCLNDQNNNTILCPGESISANQFPNFYRGFMVFNTISFISSMCVTLLLVSGVPLKHKAVMWVLCVGMCVTLTCLVQAYIFGVSIVTPADIVSESVSKIGYNASLGAWIGILVLIALFFLVRFKIWFMKKCGNKIKCHISIRARNGRGCCFISSQ